MEIIVGKTAGFCYGVKRAIDSAEKELENKKIISCLGEIVHNSIVTNKLKSKGMNFIDNIEESTDKTLIRAHGVEKEVYEYANKNNIELLDCTCPKVKHIHEKVKKYVEEGHYVFLAGNKKHPENIGTISYCTNGSCCIETKEDIEKALEVFYSDNNNKLLLIAQTTYSIKKFKELELILKEKLDKEIKFKVENTICKATEVRQIETEELSKKVDLMIIIGGKNSSNTKKLYDIAKNNLDNSICIETCKEIKNIEIFKKISKIGIMAGASTPQESINEVIEFIKNI